MQLASTGDLVEYAMCWSGLGKNRSDPCNMSCCSDLAIVIEVIDDVEVPPAYRLLWSDGRVEKEWADELSVISTV